MNSSIITQNNLKKLLRINRPHVFLPMAVDILHYGHTRIISKASKLGNVIIGLMTDKGILLYKKNKSFFKYKYRKEIISSLKNVECVIPLKGLIYSEITEIIKPDYFVHGSDWNSNPQLEAKNKLMQTILKNKLNCQIKTFKYTKKISSTIIKNK